MAGAGTTERARPLRARREGAAPSRPRALELRDVWRGYQRGGRRVDVLRGAELTVATGEAVAVVGRSGSGKSTLLHVAGGLVAAERGAIAVAGRRVDELDAGGRAGLRRRSIGFVFQFFHLLPHLSVLDNVALPLLLDGEPAEVARRAARPLLDRVGLADRAGHRPGELSGGEAQRAAVARAVVARPSVVLADEPTGNLDAATAEPVLDLLLGQVRATGAALVLVTHDDAAAARADRVLHLRDGVLA